ncbi:RNA-binding protein (plasmid) [Piscirickettsia salmonis]|uniref:RNA recognition motif-containing protein n=2 Tax=Piscirickettsia salmonis TaxID=1238 RepID=A0A9Q6LQ47_PISSA|nr:RNA-binding protein [Piscirickettsia salmonis]ALA26752.1 RNA-binding protein [Piscirickettsia salmonis]APS55688.1 RNA-binding protein [Piscirickettsia salmonis]QGN97064.1 RNA recognition motif-containing protein [Piscirickettsia salmonis]QGO07864.1 RNA recognition motif-containing protein [Piscirickettsia salmonis]QGO36324.1 RNA recognition motif-containing protein [Piscirickettsia salmonis]
MKKLYVGNLTYSVEDRDLVEMFSKYGEVISARVITDRDTGRSKGFAFVEFQTQEQAQAALELDGKDSGGRNLKVNMAKPQEKRQNSW